MKKSVYLVLSIIAFAFGSPAALACWSDSDCPYDKVCECPSSSPTGNCSSAGRCVSDGRDWKALKKDLNETKNIQSQNQIILESLKQNEKALNILEEKLETKRTCSISCSGNGWTNSCSAEGCNTCIPAKCSENHCEAGCAS